MRFEEEGLFWRRRPSWEREGPVFVVGSSGLLQATVTNYRKRTCCLKNLVSRKGGGGGDSRKFLMDRG